MAVIEREDNQIKIAQLSATFPPYQGGTGNVCYQTARELTYRGYQVTVITAAQSDSPAVEYLDGIHIRRIRPIFSSGNAHLLPSLNRLSGFDLLHLHYPFYGGEFVTLSAHLYNIPLVITYHHDVLLQGWKGYLERFLRGTVERWLLSSARVIVFTSQDYAHSSDILPYLLRSEHMAIIPNGVDLQAFYPGNKSGENQPPSEDFLLLMVARLDQAHYFKGVEFFLRAVRKLPGQVRALIVGDGDMRQYYENLSRDLKLDKRVKFAGPATAEELRDYYQHADVTVLPSTTRGEAFGLVLLESFACGTPVIASDLPGVRTVVEDGYDGFLVKPGDVKSLTDKIWYIFDHKRLAAEMGKRGRSKVEQKYSWKKVVGELEQVYYRIIKEQSWNSPAQSTINN